MPAERYFLDDSYDRGATLELKGTEFHHLARVMRVRKGEFIELVNGRGSLVEAIVDEVTKDKATLRIESVHTEPKSPCRLLLAQAIVKLNRLDFIFEKGTELGVDTFWLFPGDRSSQKEMYPAQKERVFAIMIAAMKQCGRLWLPSLVFQPGINEWSAPPATAIFFGDPRSDLWLADAAGHCSLREKLFVTGPEGGFSEEEELSLKNLGGVGVCLHNNILRTETASIMALSLLWDNFPATEPH